LAEAEGAVGVRRGEAVGRVVGGGGGGRQELVVVVAEGGADDVSRAARGRRHCCDRRGGGLELPLDCLVELAAAVRRGLLAVLARHDDVPVVLDGVVRAPREQARDHRPLVAVEAVRRHQPLFFLVAEGPLADPRVQLVEPPEAAALPCMRAATPSITPCTCVKQQVYTPSNI